MALRGPDLRGIASSIFLPGPVADLETTTNQVIARELLKVKRTYSLRNRNLARDRWALTTAEVFHLLPDSPGSHGPGESPDSKSHPDSWLQLAMARLGALVCCLLAAWHCRPGLGRPLAPAGAGPAVGESSVSFPALELPASRGQSACALSGRSEWAPRAPGTRGGRGDGGTRVPARFGGEIGTGR